MFHQAIKSLFFSAVESVVSDIGQYVPRPGKDLSRSRKLPAGRLIPFLVCQGSSGTRNELLDFFGMDPLAPTAPALCQQRSKLGAEALEAVFRLFGTAAQRMEERHGYRFLAADGSTFTFLSSQKFAPPEYFVSGGHSAKGFHSMHLNALYDLDRRTYADALIQPVHGKDEFRAFCTLVDRQDTPPGIRDVYVGDRGFCSYNNMAHVMEKGQYFLFRTKDIHSKGLVGNFDFPDSGRFDAAVDVSIVRSHSKAMRAAEGYTRFVDKATSFDFLEYGSPGAYKLSFRVVRFPLSGSSYECVVTNLPPDEFPAGRVKEIYSARWGIEGSFRKLKYTIGLSSFHACKPEYVKQEIWAKLTAYNITEILVRHAVVKKEGTKHEYKVNFSTAAHVCRVFLRLPREEDRIDVMALLQKELIPIRDGRKYARLKTAHFRKPRYFIYRAA